MNMKYAMRSEDTEQINVVSWANWNMNRYPELRWLFHVPNGGSRNRAEAVHYIIQSCSQLRIRLNFYHVDEIFITQCIPYDVEIICKSFFKRLALARTVNFYACVE